MVQTVELTADPVAFIVAMIARRVRAAPQGDPPCGSHAPQGGPHGEAAKLQLAEQSLTAMAKAWTKDAKTHPVDACSRKSAEELAVEFCRAAYAHPALIGFAMSSRWCASTIPSCAEPSALTWPPSIEDFTKELALSCRGSVRLRRECLASQFRMHA